MEDRGGISCSEVDYMKDIEEINFGSSSDEEEDDDEPRLRIDTSEDDDEEMSPSNHGRTSSQNRGNASRSRTAGANPLLSLQQLVHSPFLNTQISSGAAAAAAALMGENQGCKIFNSLANENHSRSNTTTINLDSGRSTARSAMKSRKSSSTTKRNSGVNLQRLSPVSIEVVPSLSHLLMPPYESTPTSGSSGNSSKMDRINSRLNYIVNKLHTSATEEEHLRHLQQLQQQSSPEAEDFRMFQQFLKSRQFQARCNSNNLEILPTSIGSGETSLISLVNSKGFRYNSTSAETRPTFYQNDRCSPAMPQLKRKPSLDSRMPPTLTVIPKQVANATPRKTNCRRSPPPMVPIESIANFRKPLNEDNVVYRLKKLGTDIELEKNAGASKKSIDEAALSVERVCSSVTNSEKISLPFLKPIPSNGSRNSVVLTKLHPPPPSLIPIGGNASSRVMPILSNAAGQPETKHTAALTQPPVVQVLKKKKRRLSAKSEYTRLAHQLVQAATPLNVAPKKDEAKSTPVIPTFNVDIVLPPRIATPPTKEVTVDESIADTAIASSSTDQKVVDEPAEKAPSEETPPDDTVKKHFAFQTSAAIHVGELPNGRPMLSCDICSGVYHKMFSLKKHYYRNHINPNFVSEKHAQMFQTQPPTDKLAMNPKSKTASYWCSICECLFDDKSELSSHLTDHPPLALDNGGGSRLYACETCNMVFSKKRTQLRHSKKCENLNIISQKSADEVARVDEIDESVEETNNPSPKLDDVEMEDLPKSGKLETSMMCLFCELSFTDTTKRKKHVLQHHHPKRKQQPCVYCKNKTFSDLSDLLKHICEMHSKRYFGCAICKIRFRTKEDLVAHNAESHDADAMEIEKESTGEEKIKGATTNKNGKNFKCNQCAQVFINTVEMGRHKKSAHSGRNNIKRVVSAFSANIEYTEQKYRSTIITTADYETEFYKNVCSNVKYNLENCMEGRVEMKKSPHDQGVRHEYSEVGLEDESKKHTQAPLSFQDMYGTDDIDSRFIQSVSRLPLATQLAMLRKANMLDKELDEPLHSASDRNRSTIATRLALAEKSEGERNENETNDASNETVFSGEWTRSRNYICGTCFARYNNFWDMEDHRWNRHPNVYGSNYEFLSEQTPGHNWAMKRPLQSVGVLGIQASIPTPQSNTCTKCQKVVTPVAEFHKHILECGGDTTWMSMVATPTKRNKKWRPYGSRKRKNVARHRGLKRNIPTTPVKNVGPPRNRQKAGDTETIQRMIANLPPKRITRRVITLDEIETKKNRFSSNVKTSSILTRKRRENLDTRNVATPSSSRTQTDSKANLASSNTLIGTKNNTPYNKGNHNSSHRRQHDRQAVAVKAEIEIKSPAEPEPVSKPIIKSLPPVIADTTEEKTIDSCESKCEPIPVELENTKCEAVDVQLRSDEKIENEVSISEESAEKDTEEEKLVDEPRCAEIEPSLVTVEAQNIPKISPIVENEPKIPDEEPETIPEVKMEVDDDSVPTEVTVTEPQPEPEKVTIDIEPAVDSNAVESESGSKPAKSSKKKRLIIKIQGKSQEGAQPVTIIRADKKKKKAAKGSQHKKKSVPIAVPTEATEATEITEVTEVKQEPVVAEIAIESVPQEKPIDEPELAKVPTPEPEEGEIDLESVIEPADENSPTLPDTSVILAAMKETMRQTDAVISSMPLNVTAGKKRKRDDSGKCKKCGVKMETSGTTCELCCESSTKKPKTVAKQESYECKICHTVLTAKPCQRGEETCEKCKRQDTPVSSKKLAKTKDTQTSTKIGNVTPQHCCKCGSTVTTSVPSDVPVCDKCSTMSKSKDVQCNMRVPTVTSAPVRCGKCDAIFPSSLSSDTPAFCDKCSRLQETECLLCKTRYISDTNDKVCGKCMLAGSTKQKKKSLGSNTEETTPVILTTALDTTTESFDDSSKSKKTHDTCRKDTDSCCKCTSCSKKAKTSPHQVCDTCGKTCKDDDSASPMCRSCRQSRDKESSHAANSEENESRKCVDCSSIVQTAEVTLKKLCDGCSSRKKERKQSSEIRCPELSPVKPSIPLDTRNATGKVLNGFMPVEDGASRTEPKIEPVKDEPSHSANDHKTPMKNVKLICRGCYGVFDTVSSYKYHCDNCKHRSTEKKPLLSFAKRNAKGSAEPSAQADSNGASFEILEGVQIKFVEMSGNTPSDKSDASKDTPSQIPLVVYESDSSPHKKSDGSRSQKKHKRTHSSPETIMDTIESVIKAVCYDGEERTMDSETVAETCAEDDLPPVLEPMVDAPLDKVRQVLETKLESESATEAQSSKIQELEFETTPRAERTRSKSKSKSKKKATKKGKKSTNVSKKEPDKSATKNRQDMVDESMNESKEEINECVTPKNEPEDGMDTSTVDEASLSEDALQSDHVIDDDMRKGLEKLSSRDISKMRFLPTNDLETIKNSIVGSRLRARPVIQTRRGVRTRLSLNQSMEESKNSKTDDSEAPTVDEVVEEVTPKSRKRKSETNKSEAKKPKTETANDLGFVVSKTNKTIPKNSTSKKKSSPVADVKNHAIDETESSKNDSSSHKNSDTSETNVRTLRRRSSAENSDTTGTKFDSPVPTRQDNRSRRNSAATIEFQADSRGDFFGDRGVPQVPNESVELTAYAKNEASSTYCGDDEKNTTCVNGYETSDGSAQTSTSWYPNDWDFLDHKSLGSILDTVNEILSRPEVSSCSSDSVDSFREEMMMFQHFGRDLSAIEKQEDESSKQDDETTTIIDLDEHSCAKAKAKTSSQAGCSNANEFNECCEICDKSFTKDVDLQNHMTTVHANETLNKNFKDGKTKQPQRSNQNGMKNAKHKCNHCQKVLQSKTETLMHMKEHWKTFALSKSDNGSHLKNSIADKLEELLLDKALVNYLKSPQETQHRNNLPLKILNQISLAKKNQFTNWKSALAQVLDMDPSAQASTATTTVATSTSTTSSAPSVEVVAPVVTESKPTEKPKSTNVTESANADPVEGYPCPMCNKTFQYTRDRNTHLIMVHAPRQSTHKHLIESKSDSKKSDRIRSSNEKRDNKGGSNVAREKIFHSYLLNDSVNTVVKKESLDDPELPPKLTPAVGTGVDSKKPVKCDLTVLKSESPSSPSASPLSAPSTSSKAGKPNGNMVGRQSSTDEDDRCGAKKKKPCRKKMSKKEMNLPAAIVKLKAEQALLQLCNSRFNRVCSQ